MPALATLAAIALLSTASASTTPPGPLTAAPAGATSPDGVGFLRLNVPDGTGPAIEVGVWLPRGGAPAAGRPLIVISHGAGGDFRSHQDTAKALAKAGFVVAALTHTGDNWRDQSRATDVAERPRQLSVLISHMLDRWEGRDGIDPDRIGAFGFSSGAFTVLTAAGGVPDLSRVASHCRAHPTLFDCRMLASHPVGKESRTAGARWTHDARIRALVVSAPALGFTFTRVGLAKVTQPVQLWQAGNDRTLPAPWYVEPVRKALPRRPEFHRVKGADHFDFLSPCTPALAAAAPAICIPTPGFDRTVFHETFNRQVTRFLRSTLAADGPKPDPAP